MQETKASAVIRFGVFELDPRAGELRRNGTRVKLQEQPLQVLLALLGKPGEVVTREELHAKLWPADTFVDFDHGLNAAVRRLRDALGDSAENPRFIETLAKRGYRFLIPLNGQMANAAPVSLPIAESRAQSRGWARRDARLVATALVLLLAGTALGFWLAYRVPARIQPAEQRLTSNAPDMAVISAKLSPDGRYLAYSDRTGLFLREVSTGETHAVNLPAGFPVRQLAWLADGSHLLCSRSFSPGLASEIWNVSVLGGRPVLVTNDGEAQAISWDGSKIVLSRGENYPQELWVMNTDGSEGRRVAMANQHSWYGAAAWSPDNQKVAYMRFEYDPEYFDSQGVLAITDLASGKSKDLMKDANLDNALAWTRDNRLIYSLQEPRPNNYESNLWAVSVDPQSATVRGLAYRLTEGPDRKIMVSTSHDGKALAYLRVSSRSRIYISRTTNSGASAAPAMRLNLDEGSNTPYTWTPDGESVIFVSDRDGIRHLYKQGLREPTPELLAGGESPVLIARMSPDGSEILYTVAPAKRVPDAGISIMAVPVAGGSPREVLQAPGIEDIQCPKQKASSCVMIQVEGSGGKYTMFNPKTGEQKPLGSDAPVKRNHSISIDGKSMLVAEYRRHEIPGEVLLCSLADNSSKTIRVKGWGGIEYLDWDADGKTFWISAVNAKNERALLRVDLQGHAAPFLMETDQYLGWAISSPNSKYIAYWKGDSSANAWLVRNF